MEVAGGDADESEYDTRPEADIWTITERRYWAKGLSVNFYAGNPCDMKLLFVANLICATRRVDFISSTIALNLTPI